MFKKQSCQHFYSQIVLNFLSTTDFTGLYYFSKQEIGLVHLLKKGFHLLLCWNEQKGNAEPSFLRITSLALVNEIQLSASNKKPSPWTHYLPPGK